MDYLAIDCPGDAPPCRLEGLTRLTRAVIDALGLVSAVVDGFSDCRDLPQDATAGLERLQVVAHEQYAEDQRSRRKWIRPRGPTFMAIEFDLGAEDDRLVVEAFGPYSIHAELADQSGHCVLELDDSGTSVSLSAARRGDEITIERLLSEAGATFDRSPWL